MHIIAAKAISFYEALDDSFKTYQKQVIKNAKVLAKELQRYGFRIVSKGTDNHIVLVDLTDFDITGQEVEDLLGRVNITVNKNTIPFDKRGANTTSGIRLGTQPMTTRDLRD